MFTENVDRYNDWQELLHQLNNNYTISFKDACHIMKASRNWVNTYIRPNVRCLYLSNNRNGETQKGVDYVQLAALSLDKQITEKIWFHTEDFLTFLENCIYSSAKQTKSVPVSLLMTKDMYDQYNEEMKELQSGFEKTNDVIKKSVMLKQMKNCYEKYINEDKPTKTLVKNRVNVAKRSNTPFFDVTIDIREVYDKWVAPHDLKDYGDTDELIYRKFFREGYIRIELHLPNIDGVLGKKVFYIPDLDYIENSSDERITVPEVEWKKYQNAINI